MPRRILNEIVDVPLGDGVVKGILKADDGSWSFQSLNMEFLALFPAGILYNHTYLDAGTLHSAHHRLQSAVAEMVQTMLGTQDTPVQKPRPRMSMPVHTIHRRIMMP